MGLITIEAEILLTGNNIPYYEKLNYTIYKTKDKRGRIKTPRGTKLIVNVKDLPNTSRFKVDCKCDNCDTEYNITYLSYTDSINKYNKYYCRNCIANLIIKTKTLKTKVKNGLSFGDWCIKNNKLEMLKQWSEINDLSPFEVSYASNKKYYFNCLRKLHPPELKSISWFTGNKKETNKKEVACKKCNSYGQWLVDNLGENSIMQYWSNKNKISPWDIGHKNSTQKIWINCLKKDYHGTYLTTPNDFLRGDRCPYCSAKQVHILDSLGTLCSEVISLWSELNNTTPFIYAPKSNKRVYWKCPKGKHEDYKRVINESAVCEFRCPLCSRERNESVIQGKVSLYLNEINYNVLHENNCTLIPKNPKTNYNLPFDNEVIINNKHLLIEVMGGQHYKISGFHYKQAKLNNTTLEHEFHYQKLKDRYKRIFAKSRGYFYLEIPYFTDNEDETWKKLIDAKIEDLITN